MPILTVLVAETTHLLHVASGTNLRRALLEAGISPYAPLTRKANCGGRGLCATCGIRILLGTSEPTHWHDRLAHRFGYPRLSCQIAVHGDMTIRILTDKLVWGKREPQSESR